MHELGVEEGDGGVGLASIPEALGFESHQECDRKLSCWTRGYAVSSLLVLRTMLPCKTSKERDCSFPKQVSTMASSMGTPTRVGHVRRASLCPQEASFGLVEASFGLKEGIMQQPPLEYRTVRPA